MGRKPIHVDAARLEQLALPQPTQLAVALELGMSQATLINKLFSSPELRRVYEQGRSTRAALGEGRRPFCRSKRVFVEPPEPAPAEAVTGTPGERVLAALRPGGRTYGELMADTNLDWYALVETVNRLMNNRRVVAREVCGKRVHFLAGQRKEAARG
ncbi:MAG: hypothetical protein LC795_15500 [Acidobacteria bacterium]|nr:hypothetical protein [Acidobacteriota bacterium]MCA1620681.1 hypothetical protein [Acidobacteriota bacterium]